VLAKKGGEIVRLLVHQEEVWRKNEKSLPGAYLSG